MQLYYMKKDGNSLSASSVVLMTVAVIYKLVLVLLGIGLWLFCRTMLRTNLKSYYWLYFTGLFLNIIVVTVLVFIMLSPQIAYRCFEAVEKLLIFLHICKISNSRKDKVKQFLNGYRETLDFLKNHKEMILFTIAGTFLQRFTLFLLTGVVYWGMGVSAVPLWKIIWLQASIYIAVDMLPIPGAQGITEAMYRNVFADIFTGGYITASLCVSRGISFYLMLLAGLLVFIFRQYTCKRIMLFRHKKQCDISISHNIKSEL